MSAVVKEDDGFPAEFQDRAPRPATTTGIRHSWSASHRFVARSFVQPFLAFAREEAASGIAMLIAAFAAIIWANSPWQDAYHKLWETHLVVSLGDILHLEHLDLRAWVNDALMAIFFFVVGLEIKREIALGELRDPRSVALPIILAFGGMVLPALVFISLNAGGEGASGWGIPMATDIAFAVGVLSLLGRRVPVSAKLLLLAVAVVDDIGAIIVIAIFYTEQLAFGWLTAALLGLGVVAVMTRRDIRSPVPYLLVGGIVWLALLESGVHATLAGVALGLMTPSWSFFDPRKFAANARPLVDQIDEHMSGDEVGAGSYERVQSMLHDLHRLTTETVSPLDRALHRLHLWSGFFIVPVFAFANAGVTFSGEAMKGIFSNMVVIGVFLGLVVGKTLGISGAAWLAVRTGIARLPRGVTWRHVFGLAMCAGIGFTVALFVTTLAFTDPALQDAAKIGIFAASLLAGAGAYLWLRAAPVPEPRQRPHLVEAPQKK